MKLTIELVSLKHRFTSFQSWLIQKAATLFSYISYFDTEDQKNPRYFSEHAYIFRHNYV